ncbi:MAG: type I 3-dehydroquinate dehydratase [Lachnospiraceae bacterium]
MQTKEIEVRGVSFGTGMPKVCVPIVARSKEMILSYGERILESTPDLIELRVDWFEGAGNTEAVMTLLKELRQMIGDTVLLFTFRTKQEGGEAAISVEDYKNLCGKACQSGYIDLIDVEAFMEEGLLEEICETAHANGVYVVASNHDFEKTPEEKEILRRLRYMDQHGADIPKIAVMPEEEEDVLSLLLATVKYRKLGGTKPVITMSMGGKGVISRLAGEIFGSAVTFAAAGQASAPGQVPVNEVKHILSIIHEYR